MPEAGERPGEVTASEITFLALVVLLVWVGQETSDAVTASAWYASTLFGVPLHYVLFAGLVLLVLPYVTATARFSVIDALKRSGLWSWVILSWGVVTLSLALALLRDAPELFADWRNLLVTAIVAVVASKWLAAQAWNRFALVDLAITLGILCVPILVSYALGSGAIIGGVRTTVFDGTTLYAASLVAIVGAWNLLSGNARLGKFRLVLLAVATAAGALVVLLSLRRSFWVALGVGVVVVFAAYLRSREVQGIRVYAAFVAGLAIVLGAFVTLGFDTIIERVESFGPESEGRFSTTNQDHINDLIDAWQVIEETPILGLGIGVPYETNLIAEWKEDSFEVHNVLLHVWLKFGLVGALAYVGFHIAWARHALRRPLTADVPISAFVIGLMVATMAGTWPYGRFQMAVLMGILLAVFLVETRQPEVLVEQPPSLAANSRPG